MKAAAATWSAVPRTARAREVLKVKTRRISAMVRIVVATSWKSWMVVVFGRKNRRTTSSALFATLYSWLPEWGTVGRSSSVYRNSAVAIWVAGPVTESVFCAASAYMVLSSEIVRTMVANSYW